MSVRRFTGTPELGLQCLLADSLEEASTAVAARWARQVESLQQALADLDTRQSRLVRTLEESEDVDGSLLDRVSPRLGELDAERSEKAARLADLQDHPPEGATRAPELLDSLAVLGGDLAAAPPDLLRSLFDAFQLQIKYDRRNDTATCRVGMSNDVRSRYPLGGVVGSVRAVTDADSREPVNVSLIVRAPSFPVPKPEPAGQGAAAVVEGPEIRLAGRHAKVRRDGYRRTP